MQKKFTISKITERILWSALAVAIVFLLSIQIYTHREKIKSIFDDVMYAIKLPFQMAALVNSAPEATILMPVEGEEVEDVADTWGAARSEGRMHEGQDIFAERGTPIYSATEGYVVAVRQNRLGGNVVTVLGKGGRRYYYAHLHTFGPEINYFEKVDTDTVIGYVGNTGNAETTPPHLHFGVYTREGPIDPLPLLEDRE